MKYMSFALTVDQMRNQKKTVTRRLGWKNAKPGDRVMAVEKYRGIRKEDRVEIGVIEFVSVTRESLVTSAIGWRLDMDREGFPDMDPSEFVTMFCRHMRCGPYDEITRIAFRFVEE